MVRCLVRNAYLWDNPATTLPTTPVYGDELEACSTPTFGNPSNRELMPLLEKIDRVVAQQWFRTRVLALEHFGDRRQRRRLEELGTIHRRLRSGPVHANVLETQQRSGHPTSRGAAWLERAAEDGDQAEIQPILDAVSRESTRSQRSPKMAEPSSWKGSSIITPSTAITTVRRPNPTAAKCCICCSIFCGCNSL